MESIEKNLSWQSIDKIPSNKKDGGIMEQINLYFLSFQKLKTKEKVIFFRLFSVMINAWVSIVKAVSILEKQEKPWVLKNILLKSIELLKEWRTFSECMELFPLSFSESEIGIIRSWEKTGRLNSSLNDLADQVEKITSINGKIKSAMIYPSMILVVVFWVIFVMMTMVVPKLLEIFEDKSTLPTSTKVLIGISDFFVNYWYVLIFLIAAFFVGLRVWKNIPNGKYNYDNLLFKIPIFWELNKKLVLSRFSRVFSGLLSAWVSIVETLHIVSDAVWNEVYRQRILLLAEDVKQWMKIWESLDGDKLFPDMMVQMIQVGEQTAKLDTTIIKVADFYDEQIDNTVWVLNKLLEPFIIVFLAIIVWFIAIAIIQPIMGLADQVTQG